MSSWGERPYINSRHHQALKDIAPSLRVVAQADDGVAEAVESLENDQILGLQWHPENTYKALSGFTKYFLLI